MRKRSRGGAGVNVLEEWVRAATAELGLDAVVTEGLVGESGGVLDLARDVAHSVARPAAPLTAYLLGVAAGRGEDRLRAAAALRRLALAWAAEHAGAVE
jgi:hypothetical protein